MTGIRNKNRLFELHFACRVCYAISFCWNHVLLKMILNKQIACLPFYKAGPITTMSASTMVWPRWRLETCQSLYVWSSRHTLDTNSARVKSSPNNSSAAMRRVECCSIGSSCVGKLQTASRKQQSCVSFLKRNGCPNQSVIQGLYSLSGKTSYRQISWSLEVAKLGVIMIVSLWNLTGISAALLPRCLSNSKAIVNV